MDKRIFFYVLIRSWNSFASFDRCIESVFSQTYKNFKILFVDDASPYTKKQKAYIKESLKNHIPIINKTRRYSLYNSYNMIHNYANKNDAVILNLDGDDWLYDENCLKYLSDVYIKNKNCLITWGECLLWNGKNYSNSSRFIMENINIPYPQLVIKYNNYRKYPFLPLHPRTWKVWLFKKIKIADFKRPDGSWLQFAEDQAILYPMLEMANGHFKVIKKPLYVYNVATKNSDVKVNLINLLKDELIIRKKLTYEPLL